MSLASANCRRPNADVLRGGYYSAEAETAQVILLRSPTRDNHDCALPTDKANNQRRALGFERDRMRQPVRTFGLGLALVCLIAAASTARG